MPEYQQKPKWAKWQDGIHPAIATPVTPEEIAAWKRDKQQLAAGAGRGYLSSESLFYADAEEAKRENLIRLEAALLENPRNPDAVAAYRFGAASALASLSEFDEALKIATDAKGRALPGFSELVQRIKRLREAEALTDGAECGCARVKKTITVTTTVGQATASKEHEIEEHRRQRVGMIYSQTRNAVRQVYECRHCGHLGLHDGPPESHQEIITHRRQHEQRFTHASQMRAEVEAGKMAHLSDHHLMKSRE